MMNLEVSTIMNSDPVVTHPNRNLRELSHEMLDTGLQQLPVVDDDGMIVGILTTYDMWRQYENKTTVEGLTVGDVMNTRLVKIRTTDKIGTAAELFADGRFKTIPVVTENNEFKGTVTAFDIIRKIFNSEYNNAILYEDKFAEN
ncbi:MAG: CBS domain-containing protein [Saprospiraceae bacterium]|nr:CBS domain-containing protein [Bacteroidia bacterium]NNE13737.1 CBS domain-containing protein [Saprospiraceae bacterium]NNL91449.1 CBS domain-containing protein [Saprospiraceae bacterium]